jgi:catechol 2,3-dioxygenase-like lactoylglutathione lyase family enzyme
MMPGNMRETCCRADPLREKRRFVITPAAQVLRIAMIGFTVSDMERSVAFYERVFGFKRICETQVAGDAYDMLSGVFASNMRIVHLRLDEQTVELTQYLSHEGRPIPVHSRANDRWFQHMAIVVSDMEEAYQRVRGFGVRQISLEPQTIPQENVPAAGIKAFKFRDPDGHALELLWFPADKGNARWHGPADRLFLGIDHTAITVSDTEQSLEFYRDLLGLKLAGGTLNTGITQERLDDVSHARVRISALVPETTPPFIEFLHYENPPSGHPFPLETTAADLWHWQTSLVVEDVAATVNVLRAAGVRFVSPDVVVIPKSRLGFSRAIMVRDPDGHAVRLVQR